MAQNRRPSDGEKCGPKYGKVKTSPPAIDEDSERERESE